MSLKGVAVRIGAGIPGLAALLVAWLDPIPHDLPGYALGDAWILRSERGLVVLAILMVVLVILWRGIIEGELPIEISREGFKYRQVARDVDVALGEVEKSVKSQQGAIEGVQEAVGQAAEVLVGHEDRIAALEEKAL